MRTARRSLALFVALLTTAGCTPETDAGAADAGASAPQAAFGPLAGEWELTFDDGTHRAVRAWIGDADGLGVTLRAERADDGALHRNYDPDGRLHACRAREDEARLRLDPATTTLHGVIVRRYACGLVGEGEPFPDLHDWPDARFDTLIERGQGALVARRTGERIGDLGVFGGEWILESSASQCRLDLQDTGDFVGRCHRNGRVGRGGTQFTGTIEAPLVSGQIIDGGAYAGRRVAAVHPDADPLPDDPLAGAGGRWQIWGSPHAADLAAGATLELAAAGATVTARMSWRQQSPYGPCRGRDVATAIDHTLEFDATIEADGPVGEALWTRVARCPGEAGDRGMHARVFTATRLDAAPALLPLLGGEWLLSEAADPDLSINIRIVDDAFLIEQARDRGARLFEGRLDPRAMLGLELPDDAGRKGDDWVGGRRIGDD